MNLSGKKFCIIPGYSILPLITTLVLNTLVYNGSRLIAGSWPHYNLEIAADRLIPFVPWTLSIYFGCYLLWVVNYILSVRQEKAEAYRFLSADFLAKCICLFFFLVLPTTNIRPEVPDTGFWNRGIRFLYRIDAADNLFPSIHCLTSWFCYIGIRRAKTIPTAYRRFTLIAAIAVCISTLTTRQHVLVDAVGGVLLAEASYYLVSVTGFSSFYQRCFEKAAQPRQDLHHDRT